VWRLVALALAGLMTEEAGAEWGRTADDYHVLPLGSPPNHSSALCSDLNGGCWVAGDPVGLCHVDRLGNLTWGDTALWLEEPGYNACLTPVDTESVIVAMQRYENGDVPKIYLNRINLAQELMWGRDGLALDASDRLQFIFGIGAGPVANTYLIHWDRVDEDFREHDRRLQLVNSDGEFLWGASGIGLNGWSEKTSRIITTSDHCVIAAHPVDPIPTVEVVKISANGERLWQRRFNITAEEYVRGWQPTDAESDRDGGIILVNKYKRWASLDDSLRYFVLNILRISGDGDSLWTHKVFERQVEHDRIWGKIKDPFIQCYFVLNYAGSDCFFAAWLDNPEYIGDSFRVISFDVDGAFHWNDPVDVALSASNFGNLIGVDSDSSVFYIWHDGDRDRGDRSIQQWGQRISLNGERMWEDQGRAIQTRTPWHHSATTDCNGGVITIVEFAYPAVQMMNRNGVIGAVLPPVSVHEDRHDSYPKISIIGSVYPNPFNSSSTLSFTLPSPGRYTLSAFDLAGRDAGRIAEGVLPVGTHSLRWTAPGAGVWFVRLSDGKGNAATIRAVCVP